jgi:paraquat-inducible protein B
VSQQEKVNPALIGAFVLGAILLGLATVFYLSGGGLSGQTSKRFILYFESDIKGLQVGAPVNFRGVKIGQVESMQIAYDSRTKAFRIPVVITIDKGKVVFDGEERESEGLFNHQEMIQQGLRARLNLQSLVTGKLEIQLDFEPESELRLVGSGEDKYPEIPTSQSNLEKIASAIEEIPIKRITQRVSEILDTIDRTFGGGEIPRMVESLVQASERLASLTLQLESQTPKLVSSSQQTMDEVQLLIKELNKTTQDTHQLILTSEQRLDKAFASWDDTMASGEKTFDQVRQVAASADQIINQDAPLVREMRDAIREFKQAARSIRVMAEYLERHPEALLRGKQ